VDDRDAVRAYEPLSMEQLARLLADADDSLRWRLVAEFL
jgi:hypothetical protein